MRKAFEVIENMWILAVISRPQEVISRELGQPFIASNHPVRFTVV